MIVTQETMDKYGRYIGGLLSDVAFALTAYDFPMPGQLSTGERRDCAQKIYNELRKAVENRPSQTGKGKA